MVVVSDRRNAYRCARGGIWNVSPNSWSIHAASFVEFRNHSNEPDGADGEGCDEDAFTEWPRTARRREVPHTMLSPPSDVPHTMLSPPSELPQTMLSPQSDAPQVVPQTMLSPVSP